jgi:hypothetical protein
VLHFIHAVHGLAYQTVYCGLASEFDHDATMPDVQAVRSNQLDTYHLANFISPTRRLELKIVLNNTEFRLEWKFPVLSWLLGVGRAHLHSADESSTVSNRLGI